MKLLFTSDWQSDFENLDLCERAAEDVLNLCAAHELEGFVVAGDLKQRRNPVDVTGYPILDAVHQASERGNIFGVILVLSNHDRVGM